jgi:hypothetical protein
MLAPFIILCRVQEFSIGQFPSTSLHPPSHTPSLSGSSLSCVNPALCAVPLTGAYFVWQLLIVLRVFMFLGTTCICVNSITCPFECTLRVFLNFLLRMYVTFWPMKFAISETYCDVQTESFRQVLFSTGVQVSCTAWEGRAVGSIGQTASLFHQMPGCRLRSAYETFFFYVFALLFRTTLRSSSKWQLINII